MPPTDRQRRPRTTAPALTSSTPGESPALPQRAHGLTPPPHPAGPPQVSRCPWSWTQRSRRRRTKWHAPDTAPQRGWQADAAHTSSPRRAAGLPRESCSFSRKAPSPTSPPAHSPASRRSFLLALHAAVPGTSTPCTLPGALARSAPAAPNQPVPTGGAAPPSGAPNSLLSRARGRAQGTSRTPPRRPHRHPRPKRTRFGLGHTLPAPRRRRRAQLRTSGPEQSAAGEAVVPPTPPRPLHLPATAPGCSYYGSCRGPTAQPEESESLPAGGRAPRRGGGGKAPRNLAEPAPPALPPTTSRPPRPAGRCLSDAGAPRSRRL